MPPRWKIFRLGWAAWDHSNGQNHDLAGVSVGLQESRRGKLGLNMTESTAPKNAIEALYQLS